MTLARRVVLRDACSVPAHLLPPLEFLTTPAGLRSVLQRRMASCRKRGYDGKVARDGSSGSMSIVSPKRDW
jgi:hypothetical protein